MPTSCLSKGQVASGKALMPEKERSFVGPLSFEGIIGVAIALGLFAAEQSGFHSQVLFWSAILACLVLCVDALRRSQWIGQTRRRKLRLFFGVVVICLALGGYALWLFMHWHGAETELSQKNVAPVPAENPTSAATATPTLTPTPTPPSPASSATPTPVIVRNIQPPAEQVTIPAEASKEVMDGALLISVVGISFEGNPLHHTVTFTVSAHGGRTIKVAHQNTGDAVRIGNYVVTLTGADTFNANFRIGQLGSADRRKKVGQSR